MRESVHADHGFVGLHREAGHGGDDFAGRHELARIDSGVAIEAVAAGAHRHHDFFERGVAGAFADAVYGAFDLARAGGDGGERIGDGQAQIVVAMRRKHRAVGIGNPLAQVFDERAELPRQRVANGVGNVDGRRPGFDGGFDDAAQKILVRAPGVFGRELDIVGVIARHFDRRDRRAARPRPATC